METVNFLGAKMFFITFGGYFCAYLWLWLSVFVVVTCSSTSCILVFVFLITLHWKLLICMVSLIFGKS